MTTIVAIQGDGFAVVGTDSRISLLDEDGSAYQIATLGGGTSKIAVNGKYLLGAAGDLRAINILHHAFQPPTPAPSLKGKRLDSFITTKFIPSLRACFEEQGYVLVDKSGPSKAEHDSQLLVIVNGSIYVIDSDYSWMNDSSGVYALGTGSTYALGAMQILAGLKKVSITQAKQNVLKSLGVAAKFDPATGSPFQTYVQEHNVRTKQPE
jgi:ATP-dependent protease HslVU (ClpYQ) peptidase subunit